MFLDLINLAKLRRAIICAGTLLAAIIIQNIILSRIEIFGVKALIIPIAVVAIGFFDGGVWGGVFGIIAGLLTDMSLNTSAVTMTVVFPIIGFFSGALPMFFISRKLGSFIAVSVCALLLTVFCQMIKYLLFTDTDVFALLLTAGLQVLWSVPFIFLIYYPCKKLAKLDLSK